MSFFEMIGLVLGGALLGGLIYLFWRSRQKSRLERLEERLYNLAERVEGRLQGLSQSLDNRLQVFSRTGEKLVQLEEAYKQILEIGKDISSLQDLLRAPKFRGFVGEYLLADLLAQVLPQDHYELQYTFASGVQVDAVIKLKEMLVPVDAKFPLANFQKMIEESDHSAQRNRKRQFLRDLRAHIDSVAQKYILPDEGTADFALLYIPAENVYYETILKPESGVNISQYAFEKRVIPVSPNSFYIYLQSILIGLKGMRVEEKAKEILQNLSRVRQEFQKFEARFQILGRHLASAQKTFEGSGHQLRVVQDSLQRLEYLEQDQD